mgnify:CR=1 FL=1
MPRAARFDSSTCYDVVVIGGGHAGVEAAHAAARLGCSSLLVTMSVDRIALMSCNPAIGGLAKGHLVREVDALGGLMGRAIDATGIQFRMLNTRKGPAVQGPRAQADKLAYNAWMREYVCASVSGLDVLEGMAEEIVCDASGAIAGIVLEDGTRVACHTLVLTTGTFLDGLIHIGMCNFRAGRMGDRSADRLSASFGRLGLETGRLKTGTPPRLHRRSIPFHELEEQPGDPVPPRFSFVSPPITRPQLPCWITHTNERTHEIIRANLDQSPMFCGVIEGIGPRYCPSIEDKIHRFADRTAHQIFLEPEGPDVDEIYVNGVSTSLPEAVQHQFIHSIRGLENAEFIRPGYAVEYTYVLPHQLSPAQMVRQVPGLFHAGQINGTSGYEEAAAMGIAAGINAALFCLDAEPVAFGRDEAYIGVLIDDLVTREHREPYRMFTSRTEYRLLLRADNADLRLTPRARALPRRPGAPGLIDDQRWEVFEQYASAVHTEATWLLNTPASPGSFDRPTADRLGLSGLEKPMMLGRLLTRPDLTYADLCELIGRKPLTDTRAAEQVEIQLRYEGYIRRQESQVQRFRSLEGKPLPQGFDYRGVTGLRRESAEKLTRHQPSSLGHASRIAGITPADLSLLLVLLKAGRLRASGPAA